MKCIAIRVSPSEIYYALGEINEDDELEYSLDSIVVPQFLEMPKRLSYIRNVLDSVITQQDVKYAGIRLAETNAKSSNINRLYIEAVIQEFFSSSTIESYKLFRLANIASCLSMKSSDIKGWIENKGAPEFFSEEWESISRESRESLLVLYSIIEEG